VDVGRLDLAAEHAEVLIAHVVRDDEQDVGPGSGRELAPCGVGIAHCHDGGTRHEQRAEKRARYDPHHSPFTLRTTLVRHARSRGANARARPAGWRRSGLSFLSTLRTTAYTGSRQARTR